MASTIDLRTREFATAAIAGHLADMIAPGLGVGPYGARAAPAPKWARDHAEVLVRRLDADGILFRLDASGSGQDISGGVPDKPDAGPLSGKGRAP